MKYYNYVQQQKKRKIQRLFRKAVSAGLLSALLVSNTSVLAYTPSSSEGTEQQIKIEFKQDIIVTFTSQEEKERFISDGHNILSELRIIPSVTISLSQAELTDIYSNYSVAFSEVNQKVKVDTSDVKVLNTTQVEEDYFHYQMVNPNAQSQTDNVTGKGVKVAVIDSGIASHPELTIAGGVSTLGDLTGEEAEAHSESLYNDDNGHGTHVAGIIAANNNNSGVVGIAPDVQLYAVKAMDSMGVGTLADILDGIQWSIDNQMDIINMSLGLDSHSLSLETAINKAHDAGILMVAASGNSSERDGIDENNQMVQTHIAPVSYPAAYENVIAVSAVKADKEISDFASVGPEVDVTAPGVGIMSTFINNQFASSNGTSQAAPHVTGLLALLKEQYPTATPAELRAKLESQTQDLGIDGKDNNFGYGLTIYKTATNDPTLDTTNPPDGLPTLQMGVDPFGMTIEEYKGSFTWDGSHTADQIVVTDAEGNILPLDTKIDSGQRVFVKGVEHLLAVTVTQMNILKGTTYLDYVDDITTIKPDAVVRLYKPDFTEVTDPNAIIEEDFIVEVDGVSSQVNIILPKHLISLYDGDTSITVEELKSRYSLQDVSVITPHGVTRAFYEFIADTDTVILYDNKEYDIEFLNEDGNEPLSFTQFPIFLKQGEDTVTVGDLRSMYQGSELVVENLDGTILQEDTSIVSDDYKIHFQGVTKLAHIIPYENQSPDTTSDTTPSYNTIMDINVPTGGSPLSVIKQDLINAGYTINSIKDEAGVLVNEGTILLGGETLFAETPSGNIKLTISHRVIIATGGDTVADLFTDLRQVYPTQSIVVYNENRQPITNEQDTSVVTEKFLVAVDGVFHSVEFSQNQPTTPTNPTSPTDPGDVRVDHTDYIVKVDNFSIGMGFIMSAISAKIDDINTPFEVVDKNGNIIPFNGPAHDVMFLKLSGATYDLVLHKDIAENTNVGVLKDTIYDTHLITPTITDANGNERLTSETIENGDIITLEGVKFIANVPTTPVNLPEKTINAPLGIITVGDVMALFPPNSDITIFNENGHPLRIQDIVSDGYSIEYMGTVSELVFTSVIVGTDVTVDDVINSANASSSTPIAVRDRNGNEVTGSAIVETGYTVKVDELTFTLQVVPPAPTLPTTPTTPTTPPTTNPVDNGGSSGGGSAPTPTTPTTPKDEVKTPDKVGDKGVEEISKRVVKVESGKNEEANKGSVDVEVKVVKTKEGKVRDQVDLDVNKIKEAINKSAQKENGKVTLTVTEDPKQPANEVLVTLPKDVAKELSGSKNVLEIITKNVKLEVSPDKLESNKEDIYFNIVEADNTQKELDEKAKVISTIMKNQPKGLVVGKPLEIHSNITTNTELFFNLEDNKGILNATQLDFFKKYVETAKQQGLVTADDLYKESAKRLFANLDMFIEHSDGEDVLTDTVVKLDKDGNLGLAVTVNEFSTFTVVSMSSSTFTDTNGHWAENDIVTLADLGVVSGYDDGSFKPENTVTRAQFAKMLVNVLGYDLSEKKVQFSDSDGHWAEQYIQTAFENGLIKGYSLDTFKPNQQITREHMALILANALKEKASVNGKDFTDTSKLSVKSQVAIEKIAALGLIEGYKNGTFKPQNNLTRAQAVTVLVRLLNLEN